MNEAEWKGQIESGLRNRQIPEAEITKILASLVFTDHKVAPPHTVVAYWVNDYMLRQPVPQAEKGKNDEQA